jgi:hypothetical protein
MRIKLQCLHFSFVIKTLTSSPKLFEQPKGVQNTSVQEGVCELFVAVRFPTLLNCKSNLYYTSCPHLPYNSFYSKLYFVKSNSQKLC